MSRPYNYQGFTLIEMLIVIAILGILFALGVTQLRPPVVRLFAGSLKAQIIQARIEAIKRNRPVSVLWDSAAGSFKTLVMNDEDSTALPCSATGVTTLTVQRISVYPRIQVGSVFTSSVAANAVVWYPNGLPRFCDGSSLPTSNSSVKVMDQRQTAYVRISPAGRVEIASAP